RSTAQTWEVTVNNVTVIVTEYQPKSKKSVSDQSGRMSSASSENGSQSESSVDARSADIGTDSRSSKSWFKLSDSNQESESENDTELFFIFNFPILNEYCKFRVHRCGLKDSLKKNERSHIYTGATLHRKYINTIQTKQINQFCRWEINSSFQVNERSVIRRRKGNESVEREKNCEILESHKISIYKPRKDQCNSCIAYKEDNLKEEDYNMHIQKKKKFTEIKSALISSY
ncbi:hypothetical protein L9F63_026413, partial [Diploptera punctata]